jgi:hypothetical protein
MGVEWYDMIARRNGGYKSRAVCTVVYKLNVIFAARF